MLDQEWEYIVIKLHIMEIVGKIIVQTSENVKRYDIFDKMKILLKRREGGKVLIAFYSTAA